MSELLPSDYAEFLRDLKARIQSRQVRAILAVNRELIELYWEIGQMIVQRQEQSGWGDKILAQVETDLKRDLPSLEGFSRRNLYRMRALYRTYREQSEFVPQLVAQIPWGQNCILLEKVKDPIERQWYAEQTLAHGWSRNILTLQIETNLYARQVTATKTTNFQQTLPSAQSDLVQQAFKDPYIFQFLTLADNAKERELEQELLSKIRDFMLELGSGFAFMGSQYPLQVSDQDFFLDLLFYHHRLRCLVVIDLKIGEFKPEDAGKMNFYLSALDAQVKHPDDRPSVGMILCRTKDNLIADYALRDLNKPIGVSTYRLGELPPDLQAELPTPEQLQQVLASSEADSEDTDN
jgi:predicted nuclease of restriction endonuclease-like (RecB) superfamily